MNGLRQVAVAAALSLLSASCATNTSPAPASNSPGVAGQQTISGGPPVTVMISGDRHPYLGALPDPMPLSAALDGESGEASDAYQSELQAVTAATRKGGVQAVAAWETLLVATGTPVLGESGAPISLNGHTGTGYAVTPGELRLIGVLGATPGGMTVAELGDALQGIPGLESVTLGDALFESLQSTGEIADDPEVTNFASAYAYLSLEPLAVQPNTDAREERISWAQVALVLRRLASEAVIVGADLAEPTAGAPLPASRGRTAFEWEAPALFAVGPTAPLPPRPAAAGPCGVENERLKVFTDLAPKVINLISGAVLDKMFEKAEVTAMEAGVELPRSLAKSQKILKAIGLAQTIASFLAILAKAAALNATFELDSPPLVRTTDQHAGEVKDVRVSMKVDFGLYQEIVTCVNRVLGPSGIQLPMIETGGAGGIEMDLFSEDPAVLLIGDGVAGGAPDTTRTTNPEGSASFKVSGAPQTQKIPANAAREEVQVTLRAVAQLEGNDLKKDLLDLPFDAFQGPIGGALQKVLARTKWLTFYGAVRVVDWRSGAQFMATLTGFQKEHTASNFTAAAAGCPPITSSWSTDQEISVSSERVHVDAVLFDNPEGNWGDQVALLIPHGSSVDSVLLDQPTDMLMEAPELFRLAVAIGVDRSRSIPGKGEMPPVKDLGEVDCGDVTGGGEGGQAAADCGHREYQAEIGIVVPAPRELFPRLSEFVGSDDLSAKLDGLYETCRGDNPMPGLFAVQLQFGASDLRRTGGAFPSIAELFDPAVGEIQILGSAVLRHVEPGTLADYQYEWTLTLCRVQDGAAAC